ncbi:hypothetical protein HZB02_05885 [Candidatus Woesearchaeota archaeon]|nr:hypothetical protein [Candidatus Woesearchaeota archaeon]
MLKKRSKRLSSSPAAKKQSNKFCCKAWYCSKTVWVNLILTLVAVIDLIHNLNFINTKYLILIAGVLNIILRIWFTKVPIANV